MTNHLQAFLASNCTDEASIKQQLLDWAQANDPTGKLTAMLNQPIVKPEDLQQIPVSVRLNALPRI